MQEKNSCSVRLFKFLPFCLANMRLFLYENFPAQNPAFIKTLQLPAISALKAGVNVNLSEILVSLKRG